MLILVGAVIMDGFLDLLDMPPKKFFAFSSRIYKQEHGVAMRSSLIPDLANIFMCNLKIKFIFKVKHQFLC